MGVDRTQLDEFALASHEKAAAAQDAGRFDAQIVPVTVDGEVVTRDEGIRRGSTLQTLASLKTAFKDEGGAITAGNSSQISDGSAALLMMTSEKAAALGVTRMARVHTAVVLGADPEIMLTAPNPGNAQSAATLGLVDR